MLVQRGFLFIAHLSMSNLMGVSSVLGQSKNSRVWHFFKMQIKRRWIPC